MHQCPCLWWYDNILLDINFGSERIIYTIEYFLYVDNKSLERYANMQIWNESTRSLLGCIDYSTDYFTWKQLASRIY